jgi:ubiquinone/menaquinone biosynthesis C-methylase UbiE
LFDLWSRFYDAPLVQRLTYRPEHDAVLRELRRAAPARVLDIGCGTGLLTARIREQLPAARVVGCDFSRGMLERAARRRRASALVRGSALALPFGAGAFDAVVSTEAFHWFPDQDAALREFFRVLAPGGRLLVSLVNPPFETMSQIGRRLSRLLGEPANWPTRARMRRRVEGSGFRVEAQRLVLRVPATLVLPSILTVASRPAPSGGARGRPARH